MSSELCIKKNIQVLNIEKEISPVLIRELHYPRHYRKETASSLRERLVAIAGEWYDYHFSIKKYDKK